MKKKLIIVLVCSAVAVLLVAAMIVAAMMMYSEQPAVVVADSVSGAVEGLLAREELRPVAKMLTQGSLGLKAKTVQGVGADGSTSALLGSMDISGKVYFSSDALMLSQLSVAMQDKILAKNAELYLSDDIIYIKEDGFLHDGKGQGYALELNGLKKQLEESILNPAHTPKSDYALDKDTFELACQLADYLDQLDLEKLTEDSQELLEAMTKDLYDIMLRHVTVEERTEEVKFIDGSKECRILSLSLSESDSIAMLTDMVEYLQQDRRLPAFLRSYWPLQEQENESAPATESDLDSELGSTYGFAPSMDAFTVDGMIDTYRELLGNVKDSLKEAAKEIDELGVQGIHMQGRVEFVTTKRSNDLLRVSATIQSFDPTEEREEDRKQEISLFCLDLGGKSIDEADYISWSMWGQQDLILYQISQNDKKGYKGKLTVSGETMLEVSVDKSQDEAPFELVAYWHGDSYKLSGNVKESGKTTTIQLKAFEYTYKFQNMVTNKEDIATDMYQLDIQLEINEDDDMPSVPKKYTRVSEITEKDLESWMEYLKTLFQ